MKRLILPIACFVTTSRIFYSIPNATFAICFTKIISISDKKNENGNGTNQILYITSYTITHKSIISNRLCFCMATFIKSSYDEVVNRMIYILKGMHISSEVFHVKHFGACFCLSHHRTSSRRYYRSEHSSNIFVNNVSCASSQWNSKLHASQKTRRRLITVAMVQYLRGQNVREKYAFVWRSGPLQSFSSFKQTKKCNKMKNAMNNKRTFAIIRDSNKMLYFCSILVNKATSENTSELVSFFKYLWWKIGIFSRVKFFL